MFRLLHFLFVWPIKGLLKALGWTFKLAFGLLLLPFALLAAPFSGKRNPSWESMADQFADPHSPSVIDFRDKWGSNNDHNWEADGDMRWDSYE